MATRVWRTNSYKEIFDKTKAVFPVEKLEDNTHSTAKSYWMVGFRIAFAAHNTMTKPFWNT